MKLGKDLYRNKAPRVRAAPKASHLHPTQNPSVCSQYYSSIMMVMVTKIAEATAWIQVHRSRCFHMIEHKRVSKRACSVRVSYICNFRLGAAVCSFGCASLGSQPAPTADTFFHKTGIFNGLVWKTYSLAPLFLSVLSSMFEHAGFHFHRPKAHVHITASCAGKTRAISSAVHWLTVTRTAQQWY